LAGHVAVNGRRLRRGAAALTVEIIAAVVVLAWEAVGLVAIDLSG